MISNVLYLPTRTQPVTRVRSAESSDRGAMWRSFIAERHQRSERALNAALRRYLVGSRDGYIERLEAILAPQKSVKRALSVLQWADLLATAVERTRLDRATRGALSSAMRASFRWAAQQVGLPELGWSAELSPLEQNIGEMISRVLPTQERRIRSIVEEGLLDGSSVSDMQAKIASSPEFGLARSLTIARTETTRAVSGGSYHAYQNAAEHNVIVRQQWLSARDSNVRDSHRALDGQEIPLGGRFLIPGTGNKARYPGDFGVPEHDINCRCTVLPIVD